MITKINNVKILVQVRCTHKDYYSSIEDVVRMNSMDCINKDLEKKVLVHEVAIEMETLHELHYGISEYFRLFKSFPQMGLEIDTSNDSLTVEEVTFCPKGEMMKFYFKEN